ncbi:MAG: phage portal protein, partial [Phycisphaerales bacterium]
HTGLSNAHRMQILEEGTKWNKIGIEPDKAQALEVMKWTVDDCSRIFQIPPHKLSSMEFSKYNNVEQLQIDFVCTTMLYWFRKWEQEVNYKLFMPAERGRMFCEILADAALRGNTEARTAFYASGRQWGYLSINDIRAKENLNPIGPAGDTYLDPLNMVPAGTLTPPAKEEPQAKDPIDPVDPADDPSRAAHRGLLVAQCRRIVTKQIKATRDRVCGDAWWQRHRQWACEVLTGAVTAYGETRLHRAAEVAEVLSAVTAEWFVEDMPLRDDDAEAIAEDIMQRMGGHNG